MSLQSRTTRRLRGRTATGISVRPDVVQALGAGPRLPVLVTKAAEARHEGRKR